MSGKNLLIDRLHSNYETFRFSLRGVSRPKLFDMAGRISAVTEAYEFMIRGSSGTTRMRSAFFCSFAIR